jgi:hypothetical protein
VKTYSFEEYWQWLMRHPNCILRAGSSDAVLYDDDDLHWHFAAEGAMLYLQVIRGKRILAELGVDSDRVSYVEWVGEEPEGEHLFELIEETQEQRFAVYFVVVSHPLEEESTLDERAVH